VLMRADDGILLLLFVLLILARATKLTAAR
jgi:hypothetical protein